jgi:hypothetical protein
MLKLCNAFYMLMVIAICCSSFTFSQSKYNITLDNEKSLANERYHENVYSCSITGYFKGDTILEIKELIKIHEKSGNTAFDYFDGYASVDYSFDKGKLFSMREDWGECDFDSLFNIKDKTGGGYISAEFSNDKVISSRTAVDDLFFKPFHANEALIYAKEDETLLRTNDLYIKNK